MGTTGGGISKVAWKQVPQPARGPYIWLTAIWASYCGTLHGFNSSDISGIMSMPSFQHQFGWNRLPKSTITDSQGWVTSAMLLGQAAGILISGPIMERRGRKIVILIAAITYTIGALLMTVNFGSLAELLAGRVISGIGSGLAYSPGPVYISEIAPTELRGMMSTFYNAGIMSGVAGAYWINFAVSEVINLSSNWQWRIAMILQMIPSTVLVIGYPFFPESPKYLMLRNKPQAAKDSLRKLRGGLDENDPYFVREYSELERQVQTSEEKNWETYQRFIRLCVKNKATRKIFLFVVLVQTFFIMSGGNSITYYAPNILTSVGFQPEMVLLFTAIYGTIKFLSIFFYSLFLTERFGRRPLLLVGSTTNLACLVYIAAYLGKTNVNGKSSGQTSPAAIVAVVAMCLFAVGFGFGWAPAFSLTAAEICPTNIRGSVVTVAFLYQNLLGFGITRGFPNMTEAMHPYGPFALFAAFTFCSTIWVFFSFPECKGRSMESTEVLFEQPWYKIGFVPVASQNQFPGDLEKDVSSRHEEDISNRN
ncbi:general substrate transporter [Talaromyces proteolyticus]|uniref:General substrate transporter n=1 Tax=Talaromyces proteolyticus TaxID=1131652 RepID=A0AAD4L5B1_9EURO|nr:general substrate transporter [Talaromyces proteolyticus]KAH8704855.1 general substrate transporter [Talaromyces proteolyticus]